MHTKMLQKLDKKRTKTEHIKDKKDIPIPSVRCYNGFTVFIFERYRKVELAI